MAEMRTEMKHLQELLQDEQLRHRIVEAPNQRHAARLLNEAGEEKGYEFGEEWLNEVFVDLRLARAPGRPSEGELMELARTYMVEETPPKLCHTESCGGGHDACCAERDWE